MIELSIRHDLQRLAATLDDFGRRQLPFAAALALTRAAQQARGDLRDAMAATFDRPKPFTLNSLFVEPANKRTLMANIHFKDFVPKGVPAGRYLKAQILGGARRPKASENLLAAAGVVPPGYFVVPTKYADMDAHGNISPGQMRKILSSLKAGRDVGYTSNASGRRSKGTRRFESYFAIVPGRPQGPRGQGGGLPPGIYKATTSGLGRIVVPVLALVSRPPAYTPRLPFDDLAAASYARHVPGLLGEALEHALRTARPATQ